MSEELKIGDIVYLKSGSPPLTLHSFMEDENDLVECAWFIEGESKIDIFHKHSLTKTMPCIL